MFFKGLYPVPGGGAVNSKTLALDWQINDRTGWGIFGLNLVLHLQSGREIIPILLNPPVNLPENPLQDALLKPALQRYKILNQAVVQSGSTIALDLTILQALGNRFIFKGLPVTGKHRVGVIFFEDTFFDRAARQRAAHFEIILTGSTWNEDVLKAEGFADVRKVIQGIDPVIFHPAPGGGLFKDRFVIFSGGKLEYRKGQDIVLKVFKQFNDRHPEALLLASWHNAWPETMAEIGTAGYVTGPPGLDRQGKPEFEKWLVENGVNTENFVVIPETPNVYMAGIMREADVALFTNRAEGGTNLVAMECLACGVPTILPANTGHLDFTDSRICYPLVKQDPVAATPVMRQTEGWGETNVEEALEKLENVYADYTAARERAGRAVKRMQSFTWEKQVRRLVSTLDDIL